MRFGRLGRRHGQLGLMVALGVLLANLAAAQEDPIKWSLAKTPASAAAGQTFRIDLTATIDEGWHLYSISQPPGGPITTRISVAKDQPFTLAGAIDAVSPLDENRPSTTLQAMRDLVGPMFDNAYSSLLEDLQDRGMLQNTIVLATGFDSRAPGVCSAR